MHKIFNILYHVNSVITTQNQSVQESSHRKYLIEIDNALENGYSIT